MIEKHYSLSGAAKLIGIERRALKRWLRQDLGIVIPRVRRGSKVLIRERDLRRLIEKRRTAQGAAA
jgi:predicted site-specific integrase-resolvase